MLFVDFLRVGLFSRAGSIFIGVWSVSSSMPKLCNEEKIRLADQIARSWNSIENSSEVNH